MVTIPEHRYIFSSATHGSTGSFSDGEKGLPFAPPEESAVILQSTHELKFALAECTLFSLATGFLGRLLRCSSADVIYKYTYKDLMHYIKSSSTPKLISS